MANMLNSLLNMSKTFRGGQEMQTLHQQNVLTAKPQPRIFGRRLAEGIKDIVRPNEAEKQLLVKAKIFPNLEAIPESVSHAQIRKAREFMRIRVNLWMVAAAVAGCAGMIFYGRHLRNSGDTLTHRGEVWMAHSKEAK